jgi:hypothetical protein
MKMLLLGYAVKEVKGKECVDTTFFVCYRIKACKL